MSDLDKLNLTPYLYQSGNAMIEVVLTGRIAKRKRARGEVVLHEIESLDPDLGIKEWVKINTLFSIDKEE